MSGSSYERGVSLLDRGRYDEAIAAFDGVIKANKEKVEGAHYWKAYAQNRLGQRAEALATLGLDAEGLPDRSLGERRARAPGRGEAGLGAAGQPGPVDRR